MTTLRKLVTTASIGVVALFGLYAVSAPFLREPPAPVVHVEVVPIPAPVHPDEPLADGPEPRGDSTGEESGAHKTGVAAGERLQQMWSTTKDFSRGLWSTLSEEGR